MTEQKIKGKLPKPRATKLNEVLRTKRNGVMKSKKSRRLENALDEEIKDVVLKRKA